MSDTNAERVKKIIVSQLNVSEEQVLPEASFIDDLGADSLDQVIGPTNDAQTLGEDREYFLGGRFDRKCRSG